jgi:hypothetical protein
MIEWALEQNRRAWRALRDGLGQEATAPPQQPGLEWAHGAETAVLAAPLERLPAVQPQMVYRLFAPEQAAGAPVRYPEPDMQSPVAARDDFMQRLEQELDFSRREWAQEMNEGG